MEYSKLPMVKDKNISLKHFPSPVFAAVFRLWELVPAKKVAQILRTDEESILEIGQCMCLGEPCNNEIWMTRGRITIIKAVWHLLPYEQILELLELNEDQLAIILKEEDFLRIKLGGFKPACEPVFYKTPTPVEWEAAKRCGEILNCELCDCDSEFTRQPFDFFGDDYLVPSEHLHHIIGAGWTVCNATEWAEVDTYIKNFLKDFETVWGLGLSQTAERAALQIRVEPLLEGGSAETHTIECCDNVITLRACGPEGILRGLQYLLTTKKILHGTIARKPRFETRMIYSFCGLFGNVLDEDIGLSYPDELLKRYSLLGINAIWLPAVLYQLLPFQFDPTFSIGWEKRIERLKELVDKAAQYGIKVFLYLNEPRSLPMHFFEQHPDLKGNVEGAQAALCMSNPKVVEWLGNTVENLCRSVPKLGGLLLINMSENLTHCYSHSGWAEFKGKTNCPRCKERTAEDVLMQTVKTIAHAAQRSGSDAQVWAWTWGWESFVEDGKLADMLMGLPENVTITSASETRKPYTIGGVEGKVSDYSLSIPGPGELATEIWNTASKMGYSSAAKIQINTTWECSTAPFLPVYDLILEHLSNLKHAGVSNLLLSWTLGGYPSDNLKIASGYFFEEDTEFDLNNILQDVYGDSSKKVCEAARLFSKAFRQFPFAGKLLYRGPQNSGPANLLFDEPTGLESTMTGFAYDDLENWRAIYPPETMIDQFRRLSEEWKQGLEIICDIPNCEFTDMAYTAYALFRSSYNQSRYITLRDDIVKNETEIRKILSEEMELAKRVYGIMCRNPAVGFEAANHYYYTKSSMKEKLLNCYGIAESLSRKVRNVTKENE